MAQKVWTFEFHIHVLSLKFRPQMVTGIQHLQTTISSPMDQK
jgi:hypothetical protein